MKRLALLAFGACLLLTAAESRASDTSESSAEAFARVVVDDTELRTGPGVSYRVLTTARRGETFVIDGRPGPGFWLKVLLPDGRAAYVLGDDVQPIAIDANAASVEGAPKRPGFFAPPPLEGAHGGLAIVGGILSIPIAGGAVDRFGYLEARPSVVVHKTFTLDGFIGDALTSDGSQVLYGAGASVILAPSWAVTPFVGIGVGGLSVFPSSSSFVLKREDLFIGRAGGGFLMAFKSRILVRLEATNLSVFGADSYKNAQTYAGGLGVYF